MIKFWLIFKLQELTLGAPNSYELKLSLEPIIIPAYTKGKQTYDKSR